MNKINSFLIIVFTSMILMACQQSTENTNKEQATSETENSAQNQASVKKEPKLKPVPPSSVTAQPVIDTE